MMVKPRNTPEINRGSDIDKEKSLVLHNDEINTFDFVINCLVEVCSHTREQAEQCAMIAHFKGRCVVKEGNHLALKAIQLELQSRNLMVTIE